MQPEDTEMGDKKDAGKKDAGDAVVAKAKTTTQTSSGRKVNKLVDTIWNLVCLIGIM